MVPANADGTQSAREQLDLLFDHMVRLAAALLKGGDLIPFGEYLRDDETTAGVMLEPSDDPSGQRHLDATRDALAATAEAIAAATVADLTLGEPSQEGMRDAVVVNLDHRSPDQEAIAVVIPYRRRRLRGVAFGEMFSAPGEPIF